MVIAPGQTIQVTVAADDSICDNDIQDFHPFPLDSEWVCHYVVVTPPTTGNLIVQLLPNSGTNSGAQLVAETATAEVERFFDLTNSLPVVAGEPVLVYPEIPYGSSDRTFTLVTSMGNVEIQRDAVDYATGPQGCPGGPLDCGGAYYDTSPVTGRSPRPNR